jgi:hypothetical protein
MAAEEAIDWTQEANAVINDVKKHVKKIEISDKLISKGVFGVKILYLNFFLTMKNFFLGDGSNIFLNVTSLEDKMMTVLLDSQGFHIVAFELNSISEDDESEEVYETIYALLQKHSINYTQSFGNALVRELEKQVK